MKRGMSGIAFEQLELTIRKLADGGGRDSSNMHTLQ
jgi:hypothetical protein